MSEQNTLMLGSANNSKLFCKAFKSLLTHPNSLLFSSLRAFFNDFSIEENENSQIFISYADASKQCLYGPAAVLLSALPVIADPIKLSPIANDAYLLGKNDADNALVLQWINYSYESIASAIQLNDSVLIENILNRLNDSLLHSTFLACSYFSLADYFAYECLKDFFKGDFLRTPEKSIQFSNVIRWLLFIGEMIDHEKSETVLAAMKNLAISESVSQQPAAEEKKSIQKKPATSKTKQAPAEDLRPLFCHLDIRVGHILSVKPHPNAESLYVEEVDFSSSSPKTILSGLVKHFPADALQDKLAVFVTNLKPASLRGIKSEGMILAATSAEGKVELVVPPAGSKPGDQIIIDGIEESLFIPDAQLNPNKKIMETVKETLAVNDEGSIVWDGKRLMIKNLGFLSVPSVRNCPVG